MRRCLRGDRDAFAELVRRYTGLVFSVAVGCGLRPEDAEDATQDAFILAFRRLTNLREPDSFRPWLCRIAVRQAHDARAKRLREVPTDVSPLLADATEPRPGYLLFEREEDCRQIVGDALDRLPEALRLPFVMHEIGGATPVEVAEALSITRNAVDRRLNRAREHVREYLRRCGLEADALDILRSHSIALATGGELLSRVMEGLRGVTPEGAERGRTWGPGQVATSVLGIAAIVGSLAGMAGVTPTPWGALKAEASMAAVAARKGGMAVTIAPGPRPKVRLLMRPGEELDGWQAAEPGRNPSLPAAAGRERAGASPVAVTANPYGIFKLFTPTYGEVTLSLRARADAAPFTAIVGLVLDGGNGQSLVWKDEANIWRCQDYGDGRPLEINVAPVRGEWRDLIIVYRTWSASHDVYFDGARAAAAASLGPAAVGRAVTGIYVSAGRGATGSPFYFSDMRVSARDSNALRAARPGRQLAPAKPPPLDRMGLQGGVLAGQALDPANPTVHVSPAARVAGWVDVRVENRHKSTGGVYVIETPTWGDHSTSFRHVDVETPPGESRHVVSIDREAPDQAGVYHIVLAGAAETSPEFVASGTNWPHERPVWDNVTDIAGWSATEIDAAIATGTVIAPWVHTEGNVARSEAGAVAVRVVVGN